MAFATVTLGLISVLILLIYKFLTRNYNYWQSKGVPCETPTFLVGNVWEVFSGKTQVGKFLGKLYSKYSTPYFGLYILDKPYLVLRNPDVIKKILIGDFNNFSDRIFACDKNACQMSGNSVFLLRNPRWRAVRTKLTSIFTSAKMRNMFPIMKTVGQNLENYLNKFDGQIIDIKEVSAKYTTDVSALCFFGFEANTFKDENNIFRIYGHKLFDFQALKTSISIFSYFFLPPLVSLFKLSFTDYESTQFMRKIFTSAIHERKEKQIKRNDYVDLLLSLRETNNNDKLLNFDDDAMVSQAMTFFVAGFESTSNLIACSIYELCMHPEIQTQLREEILTYIKDDEDINFDNFLNLKYLDMVLAETLRRYPFAPFLNRKCKEDYYVKETGFTIEKGTNILVPTDGLHYDPNFYPEPEKFIPERFNNDCKFTNDVYMPFGAGPRFCIGDRFSLLASKISLIYYLQNFTFEKCANTPNPITLNPRSPFVLCDGGIPMIIRRIKK